MVAPSTGPSISEHPKAPGISNRAFNHKLEATKSNGLCQSLPQVDQCYYIQHGRTRCGTKINERCKIEKKYEKITYRAT